MHRKIKNILYPKFNELDALILLVSLYVPFVFNLGFLIQSGYFNDNAENKNSYFAIFFIMVVWTYLVLKNVILKKLIPEEEKRTISLVYYAVTSMLTLFSSFEILLIPIDEVTYLDILTSLVVFYFMIKSVLAFAFLRLQKYYRDLVITQMEDSQASIFEVVFSFVTALSVFYFIKDSYSVTSQIILIHIYTSIILRFGRFASLKLYGSHNN